MREHLGAQGPRDARQRHIMGALLLMSSEDHATGKFNAIGMPIEIARQLGVLMSPDERLDAMRDAQRCEAVLAATERLTAEHIAEECHPADCDGRCGPIYFFSQVIDMIEQLLQPADRAVDQLLAEMGTHARADGEQHEAR